MQPRLQINTCRGFTQQTSTSGSKFCPGRDRAVQISRHYHRGDVTAASSEEPHAADTDSPTSIAPPKDNVRQQTLLLLLLRPGVTDFGPRFQRGKNCESTTHAECCSIEQRKRGDGEALRRPAQVFNFAFSLLEKTWLDIASIVKIHHATFFSWNWIHLKKLRLITDKTRHCTFKLVMRDKYSINFKWWNRVALLQF